MSKQNELVNLARTGASGGGSKNMVINGDMRIDQRNSGSAVSSHMQICFLLTVLGA